MENETSTTLPTEAVSSASESLGEAKIIYLNAPIDWISVIIPALAFIISLVTLILVYRQMRSMEKQTKILSQQNKLLLTELEHSGEANRRIGEGDRLLATSELIIRLETDNDHLKARRVFAEIRDHKKHEGFLGLLKKHDALPPLTEREKGSEEASIESDYQSFIQYLNTMEIVSVGMQNRCYDEPTLKRWQRSAYVRNIQKAYDAITYMQKSDNRSNVVFKEAIFLARYWAQGDEAHNLGPSDCEAAKIDMNRILGRE